MSGGRRLRASAWLLLALALGGCQKSSSEVDIPGELEAVYSLSDSDMEPDKRYLAASFRAGKADVLFDQGETLTVNGVPMERDDTAFRAILTGPEAGSYVFELDVGERGVFSHEVVFGPPGVVVSPSADSVHSPDVDLVVQIAETAPSMFDYGFLDFPNMGAEVKIVESVKGFASETDPTQVVFPADGIAESYDFLADGPDASVNAELRLFRSGSTALEDPSPYLSVAVSTSRMTLIPILLKR